MTNLAPDVPATFDPVVEIELSTRVLGGPGGPANAQAQALVNRTQFLADEIANITWANLLSTNVVPEVNGGTGKTSFSAAMNNWVAHLPTVLPGTAGLPWNNGGVISIS